MPNKYLSSYTLDWPTQWADILGTERPLILEIGFGNGDHLIALAQHFSDHNVIGLEISNKSLEKAEKKIRNRRLSNACAVNARGETALHHLFAPDSLQQVHINYPDPWFKSRHSGRRLLQRDTLDAIVSRLQAGGLLYLATDIREYAEMSRELLRDTPGLDNLLDAPWVHHLPERLLTTKYEQKGLREGRAGHYFKYRRNAQPAPDVPLLKELDVPHIILQTPLDAPTMLERFEKLAAHTAEGIHVSVIAAYMGQRYDRLLFEANIEEPTIEQHIGLMLTPRGDDKAGEFTLRYQTIGHPRPTLGMHHATRLLAEWIVSLHPDARIISSLVRTD
jgi:tRNA (guanine-N7-)-methyltransferase